MFRHKKHSCLAAIVNAGLWQTHGSRNMLFWVCVQTWGWAININLRSKLFLKAGTRRRITVCNGKIAFFGRKPVTLCTAHAIINSIHVHVHCMHTRMHYARASIVGFSVMSTSSAVSVWSFCVWFTSWETTCSWWFRVTYGMIKIPLSRRGFCIQ